MDTGLVEHILHQTGAVEKRKRMLPARVVVFLVIAMTLFAKKSMPEVLNILVEGLRIQGAYLLGALLPVKSALTQARHRLGPGGVDLPGVVAKAYTGQFTYLLTGEDKPELGVVPPKRNLFGDEKGTPGLGAWELKLRYSNLQINDGTLKSNRAGTFYFGANWYLNRFVRYLLDFGIERYKDPLRTPRPGDNNFFVVLSRVQVAF